MTGSSAGSSARIVRPISSASVLKTDKCYKCTVTLP